MARTLIEIKADTTQYQQAMKQAAAEMKNLTSEYSLAAAQAKLSGSAQDALKAKVTELTAKIDIQREKVGQQEQQYSSLKEKLDLQKTAHDQLKQKLDAAKQAYEASAKATGEDSEETKKLKEEYDKLNAQLSASERQIQSTETAMTRQQTAVNQTNASLAEMEAELRDVNAELARAPFDAYAQKAEKIGGTLTRAGQAIMPLSAGVAALAVAAVKTTAEFDAEMSKVSAISGAVGEEFDSLRGKAREMGSKTKFSATEAAQGMEYMAMAGWKTQDMLDGIEGVMNLAAAAGEDLGATSDIVTNALTAFGLTAKDSGHFADVLAVASAYANTNVSMMGETFKYCAPVAGALGFSIEQTAEAIGLMGNAGIQASQAGTSLRSILTALAGEVKICGSSIGEVEIATTNANGSMRDLNDILSDCRAAFAKLSESEQASAAQSLVGKNAMSGFLALMNAGEEDITKLSDAISNCDGAAKEMAETMQDNLEGQLTTLKSKLQELAISFGDVLVPMVRNFVTHVQNIVDKLNSMDEGTKQAIVRIGLFVVALGPTLVGLGKIITATASVSRGLGTLAAGLSKIGGVAGIASKATGILSTAMSGASTAIGLIASPAGIAVIAIAAIAAVIKHLWDTNEDFRKAITDIWERIKNTFKEFSEKIKERLDFLGISFEDITNAIKAIWNAFCELLGPPIIAAFDIIATVIEVSLNTIIGLFDLWKNIATGNWSGAWESLKSIVSGEWSGIQNIISAALDMIKGITSVFLDWFGTSWESATKFASTAWKNIKNVISTGILALKSIFSAAIQIITLPFAMIWENCKGIIQQAWEEIKRTVSNSANEVKDAVSKTWSEIKLNIIEPITASIKETTSKAWEEISKTTTKTTGTIKSTTTTAWNAIKSATAPAWETIKKNIQGPITEAKDTISTVISNAKKIISSTWQTIKENTQKAWENIKSAITAPINEAKETVSRAIEAIKKKFDFSWELPKIKLPHFNISGSFKLNPPSVPQFSIEWYKSGGIMTKPTIFGAIKDKMLGGGEAGEEAILPLTEFYDKLGAMLDRKMEAMAAGTNVYVYVTMDGEVVATKVYTKVEDKMVGEIRGRR